jgi:Protein of unknown function DUF262
MEERNDNNLKTTKEQEIASTNMDYETGVEPEDLGAPDHITEPFDPSLIRVESKIYTLDILLSRMHEDAIDLAPDFQRGAIWTDAAQSRLIESILLRIPLPAFYMDATDEDRWLVVDGLQRLTALKRFVVTKELVLRSLEYLEHFSNQTYDDLPRSFQRRISETQVTVFLIEKQTPPELKFNIFKRINTGGLPLSTQEIRHALNQGPATLLLAKLASSNEFKEATKNSVRSDRMVDREFVLRFLAFSITPYREYSIQDLDGFLNDAMLAINQMPPLKREELEKRFLQAMNAARAIFGSDAFRKRYSSSDSRHPINKALFDTWSVNLGELDDDAINSLITRRDIVQQKFMSLMNNSDFNRAVTQSTADVQRVHARFSCIAQLIEEVLE